MGKPERGGEGPIARAWPVVRHRLGSIVRETLERGQRLDPSRLGLARELPELKVAFVSVYRARNADLVRAILRGLPARAAVKLWSLDEVPADLASDTVGTGGGLRFVLLNRLVGHVPEEARRDALVLADDDIRFVVGDLGALVEIGRRCGLDLYQPAHSAASYSSFPIVRRRPLTFVRRTTFVEQGPVVVMSAAGQRALLPLPEDLAMGWGSEIRWADAARRGGLSMGIVDAVAVRHLYPIGESYDRETQRRVLDEELRRAGIASVEALHVETGRVGLREAWRTRR